MAVLARARGSGRLLSCLFLWTLGNIPIRLANALAGDIVLMNGKIHTMDQADSVASVVAIKDGKIVYVGNTEQDAHRAVTGGGGEGREVKTVNLGGRVALPGLVDSHNHIVLMGNRPGYHTPLENAYSIADVQATLRARAAAAPSVAFITTIGGFNLNQFSERRLPTLAELDAAVPDHPVFVSQSFLGPSTTNSLGRGFFTSLRGDDLAPAVAANGSMASGQDTGRALLALRRRLTFEDRKRSVRDAMAYAASMGVTTHLDQGAFPASGTPSDGAGNEDLYAMHQPWLAVYRDDELRDHGQEISRPVPIQGQPRLAASVRLRTNFLHMDAEAGVPTLQARLQNSFPFFGNDMVRTGGIGEFISSNYSGGPVFEEAALRIAKAGWRLEVHSLTDSDFASQIQAFEAVDARLAAASGSGAGSQGRGVKSLRWVIAHVPLITREYLARLKALGGGVNLSGWQYLAGRGPKAGPPFRDIVASGIRAGFGADGMNIAPMNPWVHAYYATTGKNALGEQINEGQHLTRGEMLKMYTSANQWFLGGPDEALLGAVEIGRLGDLIVLNEDYFSVPDEGLKKLKSVLTVVGGVVVHDSGELR